MKKTAVDIIRQISIEVEDRKLSLESMVRDIKMMRFKVRSIIGDISALQTADYNFVESLWKIGRIDEIISGTLHELDEDDQDALMEYFENMESDIQRRIRDSLSLDGNDEDKRVLKIEIFKDVPLESAAN